MVIKIVKEFDGVEVGKVVDIDISYAKELIKLGFAEDSTTKPLKKEK